MAEKSTPAFKLAIELSKTREKLNELSREENLTEEQEQEMRSLTDEYPKLEARWRAAATVEERATTQIDGETREIQQLRTRVKATDYVTACLEERSVDGAAIEFNAALKMPGNKFPLALLAPEEERATSDTDIATLPNAWLDRLLAQSAATRLGVSNRSVPTGAASFPVTTAGASGSQRGRSEDAASAPWVVGVTEMKPKRNAVHLEFSVEDAARMPGLEESLTRDMRAGLMEAVDKSIFSGDSTASGTASDITGLSSFTGLLEKEISQTNKLKPAETLQAFVELCDGIHAESLSDLMVVSTVGANQLWLQTIASATENQTLAQFMMASGLSWGVRGNIETATTNNKFGAFVGRGRGIQGAGIVAMWSSGELLRDPYSKAKSGEVLLSLNYLYDFSLPRSANFARIKFVT